MSLATRNIEPIPGYTLRERIGAGGYGEVWKADAPGGLAKAIKLVYGYADGDRATRESKALSLIKSLRHPFLLSLERIEIVDGQLVIVTELADCSLKERFELRRLEGLRGIPRPELLQFMRDASDALDYMNDQHSLQHLDVKPENLLLVGEHVKVADFGLVKDVQKQTASMLGGLTPVYASPELFSGSASRRSDQYSLAIVYQEMLTGVLPFPGKTAAQLAAQHINAKPLLFSLPPGERKVVARALAKDPSKRFASCREFVDYLSNEALQNTLPVPETWFASQNSPPREEVENVSSTMCLNTARMSSPLADHSHGPAVTEDVPNYDTSSACEETQHDPYAREELPVRESDDMFADLDDTVEQVDTAFSTTFVMRKAREPRLTHVDAKASDEKPSLRPTVIVGIGHVASLVMQRLKQRLVDRLGKAEACPAVQFLLLDADSQEIQRAARGDDGAPLDPQEVMLLGLRKSQEYRNESPALLQWLSRRWLFNIPRSQTPEGLRPLGRLAFVDQARTVRDRLRKSLQKAAATEAMQITSQATGVPVTESPRVIVLGAICGGTAGGMLLDVCYLARQLLERSGHADRDVLGLMMHYRGRQPAAHELAVVNTYATLAELDYYTRPEKGYPGDASCGLEPRKEDHAPMRSGYFVHLGDLISDTELVASADRVAEYLYLDCLTALSTTLQASREPAGEEQARGLALRSFGVSQIGFSSGDMVPWAAMSLCTDLFQRWMGDGQGERGEVEATAEREAEAFLKSQRLEMDFLLQTFLTEVGRRLPDKPDAYFHSLLSSSTKALDAAALAQLDFNAVLARLSETLASRSEDGLGPEAKYPQPMQQIASLVDAMAKKQAQEISQWVVRRTASAGLRMCGAERAASVISKQLTAIHDTARGQRKQITEKLDQLEQWLGAGDPSTGNLPPARRSPHEFEARYLEYGRLRMFNAALFFLQQLARRIKNALVPMNDQLGDARRDLKGLTAQMSPGELTIPETLDLDAQLRRALMNEFIAQRGRLVQELDNWLEGTLIKEAGGFLPCVTRGGEHRMRLVTELFHNARSSLLQSLKGLNVATFLLESCEGEGGVQEQRLAASLDAACPKPLTDVTCRTLIAMSENFNDDARRTEIATATQSHQGALPALVGYRDSDVSIVCELSDLSIADLAVRLIDERVDFVDYARRIFSRSDIPFEPLAPKEEEQEVSA